MKTYILLRQQIPSYVKIDSFEVVKEVEKYRQIWKPKKVNVILLAESHVFTDEQDFNTQYNSFQQNILPDYPMKYVRFVYCLGYGESNLLNWAQKNKKNSGTIQYWKIFISSISNNECDLGFDKVKKTNTFMSQRINNKIEILTKMKNMGIWLLDASIIGIYRNDQLTSDLEEKIFDICWKNHMEKTLRLSNPKHIIVIGKKVENYLNFELRKLDIPYTSIRQPQGDRRSSQEQLEKYKTIQKICSKYQ